MSKIKTRFAPSPTGFLHVGGLRTAIYNYLFAKKNKGQFLLRIEDTDQKRLVKGSDKKMIKIIQDFGLKNDNREIVYQSKRLDIYQKHIKTLLDKGLAYYCFCSSEKLEKMKKQQIKEQKAPKYDGTCRHLSQEQITKNLTQKKPYVIRVKTPENKIIKFNDLIRGEVVFNTKDIDDQVLLKSDGFPTYHLANVVDDHLMKISHVIRGEEWLSSTPKHLILYDYFRWQPPQYAHQSLLLNPDKTKLSKRQGDVAVSDYLEKGYLPEALINFLATIGWSEQAGSEQEIYNLKQLIDKFDISRLNKSGAVFNLEKLDWLNGYYIRQLKIDELIEKCKPYLKEISDKTLLKKIVTIEQDRLKKLSDISQNTNFYYKDEIDYKQELLIWKKSTAKESLENLTKLEDFLISLDEKDFNSRQNLETKIIEWIKNNNYGVGDILWPMRVALSGLQNSPGPFEIAWVLGKKKTIERINQAQIKLK